jgi:hypothetical protein
LKSFYSNEKIYFRTEHARLKGFDYKKIIEKLKGDSDFDSK